jgi:hypothetical protein
MYSLFKIALCAACLLAGIVTHMLCAGNSIAVEWEILASILALCPLAMSFSGGPNVRDANLKATLALPNAASTTVNQATGFDTEHTTLADMLALLELLFTAPALTTVQLPNAATMTYNLIGSAAANMSAPTILQQNVIVQTGAGGVGAALATARARLPTNFAATGLRYIGIQIVSGATATNSSAVSATHEMLF